MPRLLMRMNHQVAGVLGGHFGFDSLERHFQLEPGAVQNPVRGLQRLNLRGGEARALQTHQVQPLGLDAITRV